MLVTSCREAVEVVCDASVKFQFNEQNGGWVLTAPLT